MEADLPGADVSGIKKPDDVKDVTYISGTYPHAPDAFERYVTDYWTTNNEALFVTEVLVRVRRPNDTFV